MTTKTRWFVWPIFCVIVIGCFWWWWCRCPATTTVFVVRHAEKATNATDTPLSAAGLARAEGLFDVLEDVGVDAIFATEYQRTQQTVAPTSAGTGVTTELIDASDTATLVDTILHDHRGETVLVAGHSNTVTDIVQMLGGGTVGPIAESDFDNLFVVRRRGHCGTILLHLHYGEID